jgi:hypothetical protein
MKNSIKLSTIITLLSAFMITFVSPSRADDGLSQRFEDAERKKHICSYRVHQYAAKQQRYRLGKECFNACDDIKSRYERLQTTQLRDVERKNMSEFLEGELSKCETAYEKVAVEISSEDMAAFNQRFEDRHNPKAETVQKPQVVLNDPSKQVLVDEFIAGCTADQRSGGDVELCSCYAQNFITRLNHANYKPKPHEWTQRFIKGRCARKN